MSLKQLYQSGNCLIMAAYDDKVLKLIKTGNFGKLKKGYTCVVIDCVLFPPNYLSVLKQMK